MSDSETIAKKFPAFYFYLELFRTGKELIFVERFNLGYKIVNEYCFSHNEHPKSDKHSELLRLVAPMLIKRDDWRKSPVDYVNEIGFMSGAFVSLVDSYQINALENEVIFDILKKIAFATSKIKSFDMSPFSDTIKDIRSKDLSPQTKIKKTAIIELCRQKKTLEYLFHRIRL